MKNKSLLLLFLLMITASFAGCATKKAPSTADYKTINAKEAKDMMDQSTDLILLDVRTQEEYDSGYINGALLIPDNEISEKAEATLTDKSATILVYCRSGRRSALAAKALVNLGYTNVYDFGGINDWDYEIVID